MFNKDFYPTPQEVIEKMTEGLELEGQIVFDPSSGKGDILKFCKQRGAKTLGCEINEDLHEISSKHAKMIGTDFLQVQRVDVSHVNAIIMNPPFSADIKHILHAYEVAPDGCKVRALCNLSTLSTAPKKVQRLKQLIDDSGSVEGIGQCFVDSERKTSVEVALIILDKPEVEQQDWSEYFEYEEHIESFNEGVMKHDAITEIVGRYVGSLKMFESVEKMSTDINNMMNPINMASISFGCSRRDRNTGRTEHMNYEEFKIELQKSAWNTVFKKMNMDKYMTESLKEKISKFVEQQSETPFTVRNIYNMLQFVYNTNESRMNDVLIEVFDKLTEHYHDNRFHVEGWKTNSHYMINEKMIVPYITNLRYGGGMDIHYNGNGGKIDDLTKALCYITGQNYDEYITLHDWTTRVKITDPEYYRNDKDILAKAESQWKHYSTHWEYKDKVKEQGWTKETWIADYIERAAERADCYERREFGKWYNFGFFEVKGFKKGTMHFKFKDKEVWKLFNKRVADIKGYVLPEALQPKEEKQQPKPEPTVNENGQLLLI